MSATLTEITQRLTHVEARLERVETALGVRIAPPTGAPPAPAALASPALPTEPTAPSAPLPTPATKPLTQPTHPPTNLPPDMYAWLRARRPAPAAGASAVPGSLRAGQAATSEAPLAGGAVPPLHRQPGRAQAAADRGALELAIGTKWLGWIGAVIVVIAVGFFMKLAYDNNWLGLRSPEMRIALAAAFGVLLLAAGELALRRIGRLAAVSLYAAGLGTLYLTTLAADHLLGLLSPSAAFGWLIAVVLTGIGITIRGRLVEIGVLALLGGYLSPLLIESGGAHPLTLPTYLTALLTVALGISILMGPAFVAVRHFALAAQCVVLTLWVAGEGRDWPQLTLGFLTLWWGMIVAESWLAALRARTANQNVVAVLSATGAFMLIACAYFGWSAATRELVSLYCGVLTLASGALGWFCTRSFLPLTKHPRTALEKLALGLFAACGALLAVGVAIQFEGYGQTIGWITLGLAGVELGRRTRANHLSRYGLIVGALGCARLVLLDSHDPRLQPMAWAVAAVVNLDRFGVLALLAVGALHLAARRLRSPWSLPWPALIASAGTAGWLWLSVHALADVYWLFGWLAACAALLVFERAGAAQRYLLQGRLALYLTVAAWVITALRAVVNPLFAYPTPLLNPIFAAGLVASALLTWHAWLTWRAQPSASEALPNFGAATPTPRTAPPVAPDARLAPQAALAALFALLTLSFELLRIADALHSQTNMAFFRVWSLDQLRGLLMTGGWALGGLVLAVTQARRPTLGLAGLGPVMVLAAAAKWLLLDTLLLRRETLVATTPLLNMQALVGGVVLLAAWTALRSLTRWHRQTAPAADDAIHDGDVASKDEARGKPREAEAADTHLDDSNSAADATPRGWPNGARPELGWSHGMHVPVWRTLLNVAVALLPLWLISFEIDRFCAPEAGRIEAGSMARQAALTTWWGVYAIVAIAFGLFRRERYIRYGGLALYGITLAKLLVIDLAEVRALYRVLSLLGVGLLLMATSIIYTKLAAYVNERAQRDRGESEPSEAEPGQQNRDRDGAVDQPRTPEDWRSRQSDEAT